MMKCPNCKLTNPPGAIRCDCGYDFPSGEQKESYLANGAKSSSFFRNRSYQNGLPPSRSAPEILFSFQGRISRNTYINYWLLLTGFVLLGILIDKMFRTEFFFIVHSVSQLWPSLAILTKRMHDRNRSPWLLLLVLIPFVGILALAWVLIEVFCLQGTVGNNKYGADPIP